MAGPRGEEELLAAALRVPEHVVYRPFAEEMVVLNLNTGRYHGLNLTAGRMLLALDTADTAAAAVDTLAAEYDRPREEIESDVLGLTRDLVERGLLEVRTGG